ncbi:MAG: hypothetical protein KA436_06480 [Oligoflexales bacterium]|nr:hypothetical protein [Oligoflexales bacterium]
MHEFACPGCNAVSPFDIKDYLQMCPSCSATFQIDSETGKKEIHADHFIIPNTLDSRQLRTIIIEWIKRLHHNPALVEKEYMISEVKGASIPFWVISLEAHTTWKGLVRRKNRKRLDLTPGSSYVAESGQFHKSYRWAISARSNLCEAWGMERLHETKENVEVDWDGFPLDSTFSRGRVDVTTGVKSNKDGVKEELAAYDVREYFDFKFSNGLPIFSIQVSEEEALRRVKQHLLLYHYKVAKMNVDVPVDINTELEIAGIQLVHLPFWHLNYLYKPRGFLRHFQKAKEKNIVLEGYSGGILKGELGIIHRDKLWINFFACLILACVCTFLGVFWHLSFLLIAMFFLVVSGLSAFLAMIRSNGVANGSSFFNPGDQDLEIKAITR